MSVVESSFLKKVRGRLSGVVFYEVNGQMRMRSMPREYKDAESPEQLSQRGKMKGVAKLYRGLDYLLKEFWTERAKGTTSNGYNLFVQANVGNMTGEGEVEDWSRVVLCEGERQGAEGLKVEQGKEGTLVVEWDWKNVEWQVEWDVLQVAVCGEMAGEEGEKVWVDRKVSGVRREKRLVYRLPEEARGRCRVYGFFREGYGSVVSRSFYLGELEGEVKG